MKLNNKGMRIYTIFIFVAIMLIAVDSNNMTIFLLTKISGTLLIYILFKMLKFVPKKYLEN